MILADVKYEFFHGRANVALADHYDNHGCIRDINDISNVLRNVFEAGSFGLTQSGCFSVVLVRADTHLYWFDRTSSSSL